MMMTAAPAAVAAVGADRHRTEIAFVDMVYPPKLAQRPTLSLVIAKGNHRATGFAGAERATAELVVLHAPIRARDRLEHRAEQGRRTAAVHRNPGTAWHLRRVTGLEIDGDLDVEWTANSYRYGTLTIRGEQQPLIPDYRLRRSVLPYVSWANRVAGPWRARYAR
jgi:hypothetical protein